MQRRTLDPSTVAPTQGGYGQGVALVDARRLVFVSGQIPETTTGAIPEGFEAQCRQVWRNLLAVLEADGLGAADLVMVRTFLTDRADADVNGRVRREFLGDTRCALTVVVAETLVSDWRLEIDGVAAA